MSRTRGWIGVDFDGTLALHPDDTVPWPMPGRPIKKMVDRVKRWILNGQKVRIVTARVCNHVSRIQHLPLIQKWCVDVFGTELEVTSSKDFAMVELWDDRAVQIIPNTGERADGTED